MASKLGQWFAGDSRDAAVDPLEAGDDAIKFYVRVFHAFFCCYAEVYVR